MTKGYQIDQPPHGYVRFIDSLGTDQTIVEAARISYNSPSKGEEQDKKLLNYLYKNRHTSPFEQCSITFNIKFPIFLMRQFVRHRTFRLNEVSARYTQLPSEFFIPENWRRQNKEGNKQGSVNDETITKRVIDAKVEAAYEYAYGCYEDLVDSGIANEQARMVLPVGIYTEIYVNCDLHNLMHFLKLRMDGHAQSEIQDVARAMYQIAKELYPWTFEAFDRWKAVVYDSTSQVVVLSDVIGETK